MIAALRTEAAVQAMDQTGIGPVPDTDLSETAKRVEVRIGEDRQVRRDQSREVLREAEARKVEADAFAIFWKILLRDAVTHIENRVWAQYK
ncbi:MAG: hypothetical protein ACREIW_06585, partial [Chthoniobacterales bacterium]